MQTSAFADCPGARPLKVSVSFAPESDEIDGFRVNRNRKTDLLVAFVYQTQESRPSEFDLRELL